MSQKELDATTAVIRKKHGAGSVFILGEKDVIDVPTISTSVLSLDLALGIGGLPRGRVVEIFGSEASGKTTLTLHTIAECQKAGGTAVFIDVEHALNTSYAERLGVDTGKLLVSQPDYGEQALEIAHDYIASKNVDIVVVDSVAALSPLAEINGEIGDSHMGLLARMMSQALRKITGAVSKTNTCVIFVNQMRSKIGVVYGNPEVTSGGNALKYYCSVRLDVRRIAAIKIDEQTIGSRTRIKVAKNKMSSPYREVEIDLIFGEGFSKASDVLQLAVESDIVSKNGSWYDYAGERLGQGKESVAALLKSKPAVLEAIERDVRNKNIPDSKSGK